MRKNLPSNQNTMRYSLSYKSNQRRPLLPKYQDWTLLRYNFQRDLNIFTLRKLPKIKQKNFNRQKCMKMSKQKRYAVNRSLFQTSKSAGQSYHQQQQDKVSKEGEQIVQDNQSFGIFTTSIRRMNIQKEKNLYEINLFCAISRQQLAEVNRLPNKMKILKKSHSLDNIIPLKQQFEELTDSNHEKQTFLQKQKRNYPFRGLNQTSYQALKPFIMMVYRPQNQFCLICEKKLEPKDYVIVAPQCGHCFHEYCLKICYFRYPSCPFHKQPRQNL